jgi:hypothetical protein
MNFPTGDRLLRTFVNFWTFLVLPFIVLNFVLEDQLEYLAVPTAVLYTGLLALYVGTKEFDRWYETHRGRHPGEWFVILWTVVMACLFLASLILGPGHTIHSDLVAIYVAVLTLYAFTHKSKELHRKRAEMLEESAAPVKRVVTKKRVAKKVEAK